MMLQKLAEQKAQERRIEEELLRKKGDLTSVRVHFLKPKIEKNTLEKKWDF